jgi:hypothetical protein
MPESPTVIRRLNVLLLLRAGAGCAGHGSDRASIEPGVPLAPEQVRPCQRVGTTP